MTPPPASSDRGTFAGVTCNRSTNRTESGTPSSSTGGRANSATATRAVRRRLRGGLLGLLSWDGGIEAGLLHRPLMAFGLVLILLRLALIRLRLGELGALSG
jgi:hypothetical protein